MAASSGSPPHDPRSYWLKILDVAESCKQADELLAGAAGGIVGAATLAGSLIAPGIGTVIGGGIGLIAGGVLAFLQQDNRSVKRY